MPEILSCIVVPDACDISQLGISSRGPHCAWSKASDAACSELETALLADVNSFRQRRPTPDDLAAALDIAHISDANPVACFLQQGFGGY